MSVSPFAMNEDNNMMTVESGVKKNFKKGFSQEGSLFFKDEDNFSSTNSREGQ